MKHPDKPPKKSRKKTPMKKGNKDKLPVFDSDRDFLSLFLENNLSENRESNFKEHPMNKHGLPVIQDLEKIFLSQESGPSPDLSPIPEDQPMGPDGSEEDFAALLEDSWKQSSGFRKKNPVSLPLKKRIKRYPPPEAELDLHGFTALGAEIKARSFIMSCKFQGYFTLRLIVGKGLHSDLGPVLPDAVEDLLKALKKENIVLAYEWDQKKKSRSGALIVYLKQFKA